MESNLSVGKHNGQRWVALAVDGCSLTVRVDHRIVQRIGLLGCPFREGTPGVVKKGERRCVHSRLSHSCSLAPLRFHPDTWPANQGLKRSRHLSRSSNTL